MGCDRLLGAGITRVLIKIQSPNMFLQGAFFLVGAIWILTEVADGWRKGSITPTWVYFTHDQLTSTGLHTLVCENATLSDGDDVCGMNAIQLVECHFRQPYTEGNGWSCIPRWSNPDFANDFVFETKRMSCNKFMHLKWCSLVYTLQYSELGKVRFARSSTCQFVDWIIATWHALPSGLSTLIFLLIVFIHAGVFLIGVMEYGMRRANLSSKPQDVAQLDGRLAK